MKKSLKFFFFFFVFMLLAILIVGLVMGSINIKQTIVSSHSVEETIDILENPRSLRQWVTHISKLETTENPDEYKVYLKTGKKQLATMKLSYQTDTLNKSVIYEMVNKGSKLTTIFNVIAGDTTKVEVEYQVKGKGVSNKVVLAMLKKSLESQYENEIDRIQLALKKE
jgi:hypothetical protein